MTKSFAGCAVVLTVAVMMLTSGCGGTSPAAAQRASSSHPRAENLDLRWGVITNELEGGFRSELTLDNHGAVPLSGEDWALYFNFSRPIRSESLPAGIDVTHLNGDFWRLEPTTDFAPLPPGETRRWQFEADGSAIKEGDAPSGFYFVFEGNDDRPMPAGGVTVEPFTAERQTRRGRQDRVPVPTPERRYRANADLQQLPPGQRGRIIPTPVSAVSQGGSLQLRPDLTIHSGEELRDEALYLAALLEPMLGARPPVVPGAAPEAASNTITLERGEVSLPDESLVRVPAAAYRLTVDPAQGVKIVGRSPRGVFYGIQSLRALLPPAAYRQEGLVSLDAVTVHDAPRFGYRGLHLDVARNFQTKATVKKLLDLMAAYKLNTFHFHLTDDEGWRLAIDELPELTTVGGRRGHPRSEGPRRHLVPSYGSGPDSDTAASHGSGFYSRNDFIELLQYADERHIEVIPEIDVPGHARAAIVAMESRYERLAAAGKERAAARYRLQAPGDTSVYRSVQGWAGNVIDVCQPSTYRFMEAVVDDVQEMYETAGVPLRAVHVGGDEVPEGAWEGSPACRTLIARSDSLSSTDQLQRYFFERLYPIFEERGLVMAGWEEVALMEKHGSDGARSVPDPHFAARRVRPYVWNNVWGGGREDNAYKLANAGYEVVMAHASELYLDMSYSKHPQEPGLYWAGFTGTEEPFLFAPFHLLDNAPDTDVMGHPLPEEAFADATRLTAAGREHILGLQGQLWSETLLGAERLEYAAFPHLLPLAERAWAPQPDWAAIEDDEQRGRRQQEAWNAFANRLGRHTLPQLDYMHGGVAYRLPPPGAVLEDGLLKANVAYPGLTIRYTIDGSVPGSSSARYTEPVRLREGQDRVKLRSFDTRGRGSRVVTVEH